MVKIEELAKKGKGFISEFKAFILRGNVSALTEDFINPLINGLGGAEVGGTIKIYGGQVIKYGDFITAVINFVIMAFVLFLLLKFVNKVMAVGKKEEKEEKPEVTKSDEVILLEEIRDLLKKAK